MMSLFKKSGTKASAMRLTAWHPDFRILESLPDTKTVRTWFFVNVVAVTCVATIGLFLVLRETKVASLSKELARVEAEIERITPLSQKAVADFKLFQAQQDRFNRAHEFVKNPFRISDFWVHMGTIMPQGVRLRRADYRGLQQNLNVSGSVIGLDAAASDVASDYVKLLQSDEYLSKHFSSIRLVNLGRNVAEGNMAFEITMTFKSEPKPPVKKAPARK